MIDDNMRDENIKYDSNREGPKISALSSGKIDKYEYLTVEKILPFKQRQILEQAKFAYFPLGKDFLKQTERQIGALRSLKLSNRKIELKEIEGIFHKIWWIIWFVIS